MTAATLTFVGGAGGVTGSCTCLEAAGARLVIDCGVFQGEGDPDALNRAPFPFDARTVVGVVLTHGHLDHVGRLPLLARQGLGGPVLGHGATLEIARIVMDDTARLGLRSGRPLHGGAEVERALAGARRLEYGAPARLGPFTIALRDAGHILGSSSVRVAWTEGGRERAVLFSGDLGVRGAPILRDPDPSWTEAEAVDVVVTESTYGDRAHPPRDEVRATFRRAVLRAVSDGGKVLIPAFAIGRTQEVLYELNVLAESRQLAGVPVVVDGPMGLDVTALYARYRGLYDEDALALLRRGDVPLEFRDLYAARAGRASDRVADIPGPAVIVAGSGMCTGGRILRHLASYLPDPRTDVIFVGYQGRGTLGRELVDGARRVVIDGADVPVRAAVTTVSGFSAHADREGLAAWLGRVPRRADGLVVVNHGEEASAEAYAGHVRERLGARTVVPRRGAQVAIP